MSLREAHLSSVARLGMLQGGHVGNVAT